MSLLKDTIIEAIRRMPEDVTIKDIICEIIIVDHILKSLSKDVTTEYVLEHVDKWKERRKITNDDIYAQFKKWGERRDRGIIEELIIEGL